MARPWLNVNLLGHIRELAHRLAANSLSQEPQQDRPNRRGMNPGQPGGLAGQPCLAPTCLPSPM
jgi:hypothetical protein